eukprot:TRINITY_DN6605_c0_g1_i1.p2 TRINITY_DN6605_c0_g1~~TRINITY_DN6605_c0_g1_i1.p2  ORF type:complete len:192 (+),score=46.00 TRINITY_DN6605_c0_g1_i1:292-867(+)
MVPPERKAFTHTVHLTSHISLSLSLSLSLFPMLVSAFQRRPRSALPTTTNNNNSNNKTTLDTSTNTQAATSKLTRAHAQIRALKSENMSLTARLQEMTRIRSELEQRLHDRDDTIRERESLKRQVVNLKKQLKVQTQAALTSKARADALAEMLEEKSNSGKKKKKKGASKKVLAGRSRSRPRSAVNGPVWR